MEQESDRLRAELERERKEHADEKVATAQMYGNSLRKLQLECSQYVHEKESLQRKLEETARNHQIEMSAWKAEIERTRKEEAEEEQKWQKEIKLLRAQVEQARKEAQDDKEKLIQFYTAAMDQKQGELTRAQAKLKDVDQLHIKSTEAVVAAALERSRLEAEKATESLNLTIRQLQEEKQSFMERLIQVQQKAHEADQLQHQVAELTQELEAAKSQMAFHLEAKDSRLEAKQTELQAELEISRTQFATALASEKEHLRLELEQLNETLRQVREEKQSLVMSLEREKLKGRDVDQLRRRVAELTAELQTNKTEHISILTSARERHNLEAEQTAAKLNRTIQQLQKEKQDLMAELGRATERAGDFVLLQRKMVELTMELEASKTEFANALASERERSRLEAARIPEELEVTKAQLLASKELTRMEAGHEAAELQADLEATRQEAASVLAAHRARKRLDLEEAEEKLREAEAKAARLHEQLESTKGEVLAERESRRKEAEKAQEKLNQTIRRHYQQEQELTIEQEDQLSLALECAQLEKDKHSLQMKLEAAAREHQAKLVEMKFELESMKKEVAQWKAEAERARKEAREERERLVKERSIHQAELERDQEKLKELEQLQSKAAEWDKNQEKLNEFEQLQHKVAALAGELAARKEEYENSLASEKARFRFETQKRAGAINQQLDEIEGLTDELSRDHQEEMKELERKLREEIALLQNELEGARQEAQANQARVVEEYTTKIRQLQQQLADRQIQPVEAVQPVLRTQTVQPALVVHTRPEIREYGTVSFADELPLDRKGSLVDNNVENELRRQPSLGENVIIDNQPIQRRPSLGENVIVDNQPVQRRASLESSNLDTEAEVTLLNEGLEKHTSSFPRRWQPRTCSLTTQKLYWTSEKKFAKTAIGSVDLADITSVVPQDGDDNVFLIHARSREGSERSLEFKAPDTTARDKWISAITSAITPAKQRRNSLVGSEKVVVAPEIRVTEVTRKEEPTEGKFKKIILGMI